MSDIADFANDLVQERIDQALAARKIAPVRHSFLYCDGCNVPIPSERRLAVQGCTHCVACQRIEEARDARHAR
ncbi:TraR/DksA family transcriptional regulator [Pseudomonas sp. NA-150]|uniref:TraR/DksA family transcriptional regulator n=1 Tax=Pseudomonas sp. NA-150 TaxID=3367525 RepID=UPI0037CB04F3